MSEHTPARRATDHQVAIPWTQVGVVCTVIVLCVGAVSWLTGGLHPQWSADIAELKASNAAISSELKLSVADLQAAQKAAAASAASDKAQMTERIEAAKDLFNRRLDGMWRPSDYADRDSHLHELDGRNDALRDRVRDLEYGYKDMDKRINALSSAPVRSPRN